MSPVGFAVLQIILYDLRTDFIKVLQRHLVCSAGDGLQILKESLQIQSVAQQGARGFLVQVVPEVPGCKPGKVLLDDDLYLFQCPDVILVSIHISII